MKIVVTGGAGYIGSKLVGYLLKEGHTVTVVDKLLFGGEHMLPYTCFGDHFDLKPVDILETELEPLFDNADMVIHLAALVGFPICQQVGEDVSMSYNLHGTELVHRAAVHAMVPRLIFSSTYSNYGLSPGGSLVDEESPLFPQSIYAKTKIAAEQYLIDHKDEDCKPLIFRFSTLFGVSPRTRFDLIINQFVLEALTAGKIVVYQHNYHRTFCHIYDIVRAIEMAMAWPSSKFDGQIYNVGSENNNLSKEQVLDKIKSFIKFDVELKELSFGSDMRDVSVSFKKIKNAGFNTIVSVENGIIELIETIQHGIIRDPLSDKHRNAKFIVS